MVTMNKNLNMDFFFLFVIYTALVHENTEHTCYLLSAILLRNIILHLQIFIHVYCTLDGAEPPSISFRHCY